jgi:hypothetical protein
MLLLFINMEASRIARDEDARPRQHGLEIALASHAVTAPMGAK